MPGSNSMVSRQMGPVGRRPGLLLSHKPSLREPITSQEGLCVTPQIWIILRTITPSVWGKLY